MPKRTKNHRTGRAAVTEFMKIASESWEVREKSGDYGVDLEIEVFHSDDNTTGIVAYVQSKGTASIEEEPSISMKVETLEYLASFDVPSIIFCHSTGSKRSFWMWAHEAEWRAKPGATTVSIAFREHHLWHGGTAGEIERSLRANRMLRARSNFCPFPIVADETHSTTTPILLDGVISGINKLLPFTNRNKFNDGITINISIRDRSIQLRIERFLWRGVSSRSNDPLDLGCALLYLLTSFWHEFGFSNHAERAALACVEQNLLAPNRDIASDAATVLINQPRLAVRLAARNELQNSSDGAMNAFFLALMYSLADVQEKTIAMERFVEAVVAECSLERSSALKYNLAKFLRNTAQNRKSAFAYNGLRRADETYLQRSYYWYEFGSVFYREGRFSAASRCYENLVKIEPLPITYLVLGDAYLYSGNFFGAKAAFSVAMENSTSIGAEAYLKYQTIQWIEKSVIGDWLRESSRENLLRLRGSALAEGETNAALWTHMAVTFLSDSDEDCWADAILLSMRYGDMTVLQCVLMCAIRIHGLQIIFKFKADRADFFGYLGENAVDFDKIVRDLFDEVSKEEDYEPGVSINEPDKLMKQGVLRLTPRF
ncbi:DUF4365 domain-containing protein [Agrobacterium tumefaciens]|uniref:DUF4365 domain-containing protein n=1 Tax=Agrobacterium tumefaciens TaxID=358 RepID=UPI003BA2AE1E